VFFTLQLRLWRRAAKMGTTSVTFLLGTSAIRFVVELFRGDSDRGETLLRAVSPSQLVCVALFASGLVMYARLRHARCTPRRS
jgi:prolipoprotein diacylglyceryltransferase